MNRAWVYKLLPTHLTGTVPVPDGYRSRLTLPDHDITDTDSSRHWVVDAGHTRRVFDTRAAAFAGIPLLLHHIQSVIELPTARAEDPPPLRAVCTCGQAVRAKTGAQLQRWLTIHRRNPDLTPAELSDFPVPDEVTAA